ncbi:MAG: hypothetical protein COV67_15320 [Nitrospinae bacterium CG11_big_fil_rev_8_21_14_0_20_56_8]|nr:MAG: hypothetical protein COV67_15320 [Nitrospinae bacterium CG11_big_fil_rev_8_21_14_0_20_56_8]
MSSFSIQNRPRIDKCIVSFSHNRYPSRAQADAEALGKARREIAEKRKGVSHLILRAEGDPLDRLKFLFPIHGIPVMCYALQNLTQSSLKEIAVVGSPEVRRVLDRYLDTVGSNGKKITFVEEDLANLSLVNTMLLGRGQLPLMGNELVLFQPGDLPFMYDMEKVLQDPDIERNNLILWLNSRQAMFPRLEEEPGSEFVQRNYHYRGLFGETQQLHDIKEPNVYPLNLSGLELDIIEYLHSTRKDGRILKAGIRKVASLPSRLFRLIPHIRYHLKHFRRDLSKFRRNDRYKFGAHDRNFHEGASILLNTAFTFKVHNDPSFVSDVDALEDWEDFEALAHYAVESNGDDGLAHIHPGGEELLRFREVGMPRLKQEIPLFSDFPAYMNRLYRNMEMPCEPFDAKGRYVPRPAHADRTPYAYRWYAAQCARLRHLSQDRHPDPARENR